MVEVILLKGGMVMATEEETRKTVGIKLKPSIIRKARVWAAYSDKRLGEWVEEAIEEKDKREVEREKAKRIIGYIYPR